MWNVLEARVSCSENRRRHRKPIFEKTDSGSHGWPWQGKERGMVR